MQDIPLPRDPAALVDAFEGSAEARVAVGVGALPVRQKHLFAAWCAEQAIPLFEKVFPLDKRLSLVVARYRAWVMGCGTKQAFNVALNYARSAASLPPKQKKVDGLQAALRAARAVTFLEGMVLHDWEKTYPGKPFGDAGDPTIDVARNAAWAARLSLGKVPGSKIDLGLQAKGASDLAQLEQLRRIYRETFAEAELHAHEAGYPVLEGSWHYVVQATFRREQLRTTLLEILSQRCSAATREAAEKALSQLAETHSALEVCQMEEACPSR